jgi:hypothetical protein
MGYQGYLNYKGGAMPLPVDNTVNNYQMANQGLQGAAGASAAMPWVSAGLSAAGLLSSLYGGYKAQEQADKNYEDQMREYKRQQAIEERDRERQIQEQYLKDQMSVSQFGSQNDQNRMAQYAKYYSAIGK